MLHIACLRYHLDALFINPPKPSCAARRVRTPCSG